MRQKSKQILLLLVEGARPHIVVNVLQEDTVVAARILHGLHGAQQ